MRSQQKKKARLYAVSQDAPDVAPPALRRKTRRRSPSPLCGKGRLES